MSAKSIQLSAIRIDGGTQSREALNQATVAEYAEAMTEGATFPPVTLFFDGSSYWLGDGFHRFFAAKKVGFTDMPADVREGTQRDAKLYSWGANDKHGLPRSNADKRAIVTAILSDEEGRQWSDNKIAKDFGFSNNFVGRVRQSLCSEQSEQTPERTYTTKHGTTAVMKTDKIGKAKPAVRPAASAPAPAPAKSAPAPAPLHVVAPSGEVITEADIHEDPADLLEELQRDNEKLQKQIAILTADDTKAELHKMILQRDHAVRRQSEEMDKAHKSTEREKWTKRQLMRCGKAIGEEEPSKIAAAVEAFVREHRKAA